MESVVELLKLFAVGATAGLVYKILLLRNMKKFKKEKEKNFKEESDSEK